MNIQDSYRIVIEAEIRSQKLYKALAKSFRNSDTKAVFHELVTLEENHEGKIRAAYNQEFPQQTLVLQEGPDVEMKGIDLHDPKAVLAFAISREELAQSIYLSMAKQTSDIAVKTLLLQFAEEEANHKALLLAEIQRLQGAMNWFDPSELNGLMED
ncbi:MAG: ferritin family protein [Candidatus Cloacimonetes bacterium]|nr:ferritin family protein [Candidatus Cloacimonadota bacterium]